MTKISSLAQPDGSQTSYVMGSLVVIAAVLDCDVVAVVISIATDLIGLPLNPQVVAGKTAPDLALFQPDVR